MAARYPDRGGRDYGTREREAPPQGRRDRRFWIPADGIDREVIQAEICFFLGNDALVTPGPDQEGKPGFFLQAFRAPTSAMLEDLRRKSAMFGDENRQKRAKGYRPVRYEQSETYAEVFDERNRIQQPQDRAPYKRGYDQYDGDRGIPPQYYDQPQRQALPPGYPPNYILAGQGEYGGPSRREPAAGNPGMPYQAYEPRQDGYPLRTTQGQDESIPPPRGQVAYIPHSGAQYVSPPTSRGQGQAAYFDPSTGSTVYVDAGYEPRYEPEPVRRPAQPTRTVEREHRRR